jgi:membrane-associated protein
VAFLQGLHGTIAIILICALLFAEECGVPLPFAPGDFVLIAAGLLIATGALDARVFIPLAILSCVLGASVGYAWARKLGEPALHAFARRLGAEERLDRVFHRLRRAGASGVAIARLLPGLRVYTTLAAGAAGVDRAAFLRGVTGATLVWVVTFTAIGAAVGIPAERMLGRLERLAFDGTILLLAGTGGYLVLRLAPAPARAALVQLPRRVRVWLALAIDAGVIAAVVAGLLAIARRLVGTTAHGWFDAAVVVVLVMVLFGAVILHRSGATAGARLLMPDRRRPRGRPA